MLNAEKKAKILEKLPALVYQYDHAAKGLPFMYVSEGCTELTGYAPEELVNFTDIIHAEDVGFFISQTEATLSKGIPLETSFRIITKDGGEKRVLSRSRISQTCDKGMPSVAEGLLTDITKALQLQSGSEENRGNADFWSKMGYGVRTPMNAILGLAELGLREETMPDTVREYTHSIQQAGKKLMNALDDIMDYKKIESGGLNIISEKYTLTVLINDVIRFVKGQSPNAEFTVYADYSLPNVLEGDAGRIKKVLFALLSNAIKFTDRGYISLSVEGFEENGVANLVFTVEDTGRGIKEEDISHLFDAFTQFDNQTMEGIGIGLSIAQGITKLLDGEITVSSAHGLGSIFTLSVAQKVCTGGVIVRNIKESKTKNILVFDTNNESAASAMRTLQNLEIECEMAETPEEFEYEIKTNKYTHAFVRAKCFKDYTAAHPDFSTNAKLILFGDPEENLGDHMYVNAPLFCVPIADALNGKIKENRLQGAPPVTFIAPKARVLVVDDIKANLTVAEGFLSPYKVKIDTRTSGAEAIKAVKENKYDLIFMDHLMPVMTGAETSLVIRGLVWKTKTDCKNVPIIALTANTENASRRIFRQSGISDFLAKPLDAGALNAIIQKWLPDELKSGSDVGEQADSAASDIKIKGVDVKKGLSKTGGNPEIYRRVLDEYLSNGRRLLKDLAEYALSGDLKAYHIDAHALNSISKSIGADAISAEAAKLETASEKGDLDYIRKTTPSFIKTLGALLDNINASFSPKAETEESTKKILMIDDAVSYLLILNDILKDEYETMTSRDAEDGLEIARKTVPDLILLDLVMPGMDGYEALEILKSDENLKHIPVLILSGKDAIEGEATCSKMGASGYIKKPFEAEDVINKVKEILG